MLGINLLNCLKCENLTWYRNGDSFEPCFRLRIEGSSFGRSQKTKRTVRAFNQGFQNIPMKKKE